MQEVDRNTTDPTTAPRTILPICPIWRRRWTKAVLDPSRTTMAVTREAAEKVRTIIITITAGRVAESTEAAITKPTNLNCTTDILKGGGGDNVATFLRPMLLY